MVLIKLFCIEKPLEILIYKHSSLKLNKRRMNAISSWTEPYVQQSAASDTVGTKNKKKKTFPIVTV